MWVASGDRLTHNVRVAAGERVRFRWWVRPGETHTRVWFPLAALDTLLLHSMLGTASRRVFLALNSGQRCQNFPRLRVFAAGDIEWSVACVPLDGGAAIPLRPTEAYPDSGTRLVSVELTAPAAGVLRAVWDNAKGWRAREVHFRHDAVAVVPAAAEPAAALAAGGADGGTVPTAAADGGGGALAAGALTAGARGGAEAAPAGGADAAAAGVAVAAAAVPVAAAGSDTRL